MSSDDNPQHQARERLRSADRRTRMLWTAALCLATALHTAAFAHGFTADAVDIKRLPDGKYRVIIQYTHLQIGEYREAHIDFKEKEKAIEAFRKLVEGAEFFRGPAETIHVHETPTGKVPY